MSEELVHWVAACDCQQFKPGMAPCSLDALEITCGFCVAELSGFAKRRAKQLLSKEAWDEIEEMERNRK